MRRRGVYRAAMRANRLALSFAALVVPTVATAQEGDGIYGRFDSALSVALSAGGTLSTHGDAGATFDVRLRVLNTGGFVAAVNVDPGQRTSGFFGVELRPFFPSVFLQSMSTGRPYLDLFLQSPGVELGLAMPFERPVPIGVTWGVYLEVPLVRPDRFANGLGLRLGYRKTTYYQDLRPNAGLAADEVQRVFLAQLSLSFGAGNSVANWEPARHRAR